MAIDARLGCSTISFRHVALPDALAVIADLGFAEIDLGALPGVGDHVPYGADCGYPGHSALELRPVT